ncbi:MAG: alpha/beta fold hydrolase [Chlorobiaceae bacterium]|nr:alpha/beta fold hydrolase [Chlorobiaceae bacterium]
MSAEPQARSPFGVLVIHGFTATLESVEALRKPLLERGIPFSMPLLAGHGASSPAALQGVKWEAWLKDADRAFQNLSLEVERVIVIGHSMGALLALNLAVRYPKQVDSLILATPALKLVSLLAPGRPLHFAAPLVSMMIKKWDLKSDLKELKPRCQAPHYAWVPTEAIRSLFDLIQRTESLLDQVNLPFMILHNRKEATVLPESATMLCNRVSTPSAERSIVWFERSGHQIFCDCERDKAVQLILDYISRRIALKEQAS